MITFAPIVVGLIVSYCVIIFVGVTNVTGCYWVKPHRQIAKMLQNTCKIIGYKKNMIDKIPTPPPPHVWEGKP